jgi:hypothetical protein
MHMLILPQFHLIKLLEVFFEKKIQLFKSISNGCCHFNSAFIYFFHGPPHFIYLDLKPTADLLWLKFKYTSILLGFALTPRLLEGCPHQCYDDVLDLSLCDFLFPILWAYSHSNFSTIFSKWFKWASFTHCDFFEWHHFHGLDALYFPYNLVFNEVESWLIGMYSALPFLVLVNWIQLGHMEGWMGYQHHW